MDDKAPSPRSVLRQILEDYRSDHPDLSDGEVATLVSQQLKGEQPDFVQAFLAQESITILSWELSRQSVQTRQGIFATLDIVDGKPRYESLTETKRESVFEQVSQWREFDPQLGKSRPLIDFNRSPLRDSGEHDMATMGYFGVKGLIKIRLAEGLPNDTVLVKEHYTAEQILAIAAKAKEDIRSGHFRLKVRVVDPVSRPPRLPGQSNGRNTARSETH